MKPERLWVDPVRCSVAATVGVIGERWTLLVLREAFYGVRRYDELLRRTGCARNILSDRLRKLVGHGLLRRTAYQDEGRRERLEYRLTEQGLELFPVLIALMQWGDRWLAAKAGAPVIVTHRGCRARVRAELRCAHGHGPLTARETQPAPGPGTRSAPRRRARAAS
jgi:DNA-binding HxlR family transcriptional regulator